MKDLELQQLWQQEAYPDEQEKLGQEELDRIIRRRSAHQMIRINRGILLEAGAVVLQSALATWLMFQFELRLSGWLYFLPTLYGLLALSFYLLKYRLLNPQLDSSYDLSAWVDLLNRRAQWFRRLYAWFSVLVVPASAVLAVSAGFSAGLIGSSKGVSTTYWLLVLAAALLYGWLAFLWSRRYLWSCYGQYFQEIKDLRRELIIENG